ncbi:class I SAM-dependent methyltransferase [Rhizorhabdus dicambivorans]|uniref:Class I SAM-dependent methyltransferase n=2 Tax=Rhizorhabdus dicambivorans TaxID=1850238 RepID=A0A2A4FPB2_9SPHN|nr:class I SAM-dependent methyltransferase [Rhizorhabdus dicambivorans]PCE39540.1 class I SAM-dependent methyltransferase [Rhizorhabdus dicambivorans]
MQWVQIPTAGMHVLNAGSGSHFYDWLPEQTINMDRFWLQAGKLPRAVAADIESLPFRSASFDVVICVGSVLNYASAMEAIAELSRVLKPGGLLILHYETSDSAEHVGTSRWKRPAAPLGTVNNGKSDMIWIYSRSFIRRILKQFHITIDQEQGFHIASAALLRLGMSQDRAARAASADNYLRFASSLADDIILAGRKS